MDTNILLESGTNELELLEFFVGDKDYGINIAKVSEIMTYREVTPMGGQIFLIMQPSQTSAALISRIV